MNKSFNVHLLCQLKSMDINNKIRYCNYTKCEIARDIDFQASLNNRFTYKNMYLQNFGI